MISPIAPPLLPLRAPFCLRTREAGGEHWCHFIICSLNVESQQKHEQTFDVRVVYVFRSVAVYVCRTGLAALGSRAGAGRGEGGRREEE